MGNLANNGFDPKAFLAKVGAGKTILKFEKNQHVFEQGDVAVRPFGSLFPIEVRPDIRGKMVRGELVTRRFLAESSLRPANQQGRPPRMPAPLASRAICVWNRNIF